MSEITLKLTASRIGAYFEKMCQRNLFVEAVNENDRGEKLGIKKVPAKDSSNAWAGDAWEKVCIRRLKEDEKVKLLCSDDTDIDKKFNYEETLEVLKELDVNKPIVTYISQGCVTVEADSPFYNEYMKAYENIGVSLGFSPRMYPDFLCAEYIPYEGKYRITVVDVKGADHLKVSAQIQIALYAKILKSIFKHKNIDNCYINEEYGIVWNKEPITMNRLDHEFSLKEAYEEIDNFFSDTLKNICDKMVAGKDGNETLISMDCMVSAQCEYCPCYEKCQDVLSKKRNARLLPYISRLAQERMNELIASGELEDDSIDSIYSYLKSDNSDGLTDNCSFWKKIKNDLEPSVNGFKAFCDAKEDVFYKHGATVGFTSYQHFSLVLTAQRDVDSGRCYAYGWWLDAGKDLDIYDIGLDDHGFADVHYSKDNKKGEGTYYGVFIAKNNTEEEFNRIDREFVGRLYDILCKIDELGDKTLQMHVMSAYEYKNLEIALYNILENSDSVEEQEYLEQVMTILYWLQTENLATDGTSQPGEVVENPVTIINSEVQKLYVLPEGIAYNLKNIAKALSPNFNFEGNDTVYFEKLSDVMDGMPFIRMCEAVSNRKEEEAQSKYDSMKSHIIMRLHVERSIIARIHADAKNKKIKIAGRAGIYKMPGKTHEGFPEIARMSFENMYEEMLKYHKTRGVRLSGIDNAIAEGNVLLLEHIGGTQFRVLNYDKYASNGWFSSLICEDTEYNRQKIMYFKDTYYEQNWMADCFTTVNDEGKEVPTFYVPDFKMEYDFHDDGNEVTLNYIVKPKSDFDPVPGNRYLVFERYTNYNSGKTENGLCALEDRQELINPEELAKDMPVQWDENVENVCKKFWSPDGNEFSDSQLTAFKHLFNRNFTVLVGPPASGKTDFIGRAIIALSNYYKEVEGRDINILVSANSHSAIENVLIKVMSMQLQSPDYYNGMNVFKLKTIEGEDELLKRYSIVLDERYAYEDMDSYEGIKIVGSTCWSLNKAGNYKYDLIIIDEASQVRAMDASIILEQSHENTRFLVVGDDDQLPPIISGKYAKKENEKYIHGSIFTLYLSALGKGHRDIIQLNDNFRMNNILCRYSAIGIYGDDYHAPYNIPSIGTQHTTLNRKSSDDIIATMMDSEYPLVFCMITGVASEQKEAESKLVASLIKEIKEADLNPDGSLSYESGNFWNEKLVGDKKLEGACGIISPHHEHINRIRSVVARELGCAEKDVYIGTVDKLQGKERRNVIVSYGVYDKETIEKESEFIFSRNRFNVSLTRGKAKTIVILSDVIAKSSVTSNVLMGTSEDAKKGIKFVQGFSEYMSEAKTGEDMVHEEYDYLDGNVHLNIYKKRML